MLAGIVQLVILALFVAVVLGVSALVAPFFHIAPWMLALPVIVVGLRRVLGGRWITVAVAVAFGVWIGRYGSGSGFEALFGPAVVGGWLFWFLREMGAAVYEPEAPFADYIVGVLVGVSLVASAIAVLLAVFLGVGQPDSHLFPHIGQWLLIPCVVLDLCSAYSVVTRLTRASGPTAVPILSLVYYLSFSLFGLQLDWWWRAAALAGLTLFHLCCQWWVPAVIARRLPGRPREATVTGGGGD